MNVFQLVEFENEVLTFQIEELDTGTIVSSETMAPTNHRFEYVVDIDATNPVPPGNYYVRIFNDAGLDRKAGYIQITATDYHHVSGRDNFDTEVTTQDIETQLDDELGQIRDGVQDVDDRVAGVPQDVDDQLQDDFDDIAADVVGDEMT